MSLRSALAATLLALSPTVAVAQSQAECTLVPDVIACFRSFETGVRSFHTDQIAFLAARIADTYRSANDPQHIYSAVGHAATWRDTTQIEYMKNSWGRAIGVATLLRDELLNEHGLGPDQVAITISSASNTQPREGMGYETQRLRALQRRVEVIRMPVSAVRPVPPTTLADALDEAATTPCHKLVVEHVLDEDKSPLFIAVSMVSDYFDEALIPGAFDPWGHQVADWDMRQQLRRSWRRTRDFNRESRLNSLKLQLEDICLDVSGVVEGLPNMACDDPRIPAFRSDIFRRKDDPNSIYGREPFKTRIEEQIDVMDGIAGVARPELHCPA